VVEAVSEARAVWFVGPGHAEIRDEALPPVGSREILVYAERSAISHGTEMLVYRGEVPADTTLDLPTLAGSFTFPIKYGYASVGTVVETGADVTEVQPGDRVFCLHPHQTAYVVSVELSWRLPADLNPERAVFAANVETALNVVGLTHRTKHYPRQLSGGEQQRVGIARAIVTDPTLLLCDEPTGDLDRKAGDEILSLLQALNREHGKTIVMVTHDPHASARASRTVYLDKGQLSTEKPE